MNIRERNVRICRNDLIGRPTLAFVKYVNIPHADSGALNGRLARRRIGLDMLVEHGKPHSESITATSAESTADFEGAGPRIEKVVRYVWESGFLRSGKN
jgi:hypothetical protein